MEQQRPIFAVYGSNETKQNFLMIFLLTTEFDIYGSWITAT